MLGLSARVPKATSVGDPTTSALLASLERCRMPTTGHSASASVVLDNVHASVEPSDTPAEHDNSKP